MNKIYGIIYLIRNRINLKSYVGQTTQSFEKRMINHKTKSFNKYGVFYEAIKKYGWNNFEKYHIDTCYTNQNDLDAMECHYIDLFNSKTKSQGGNGYNIKDGGSRGKHSEETKQKLSESRMPFIGKNHPNFGKPMKEETKQKLSLAKKGIKLSDETRKKMSESKIGIKFSEEHKNKISKARLGKKNPFYGKSHSEETKLKMSVSLKGAGNPNYGRKISEEVKEKMRLGKSSVSKVIQCNETGQIFRSVREAARQMNLTQSRLNAHVLNKKGFKSVKGFTFKIV